MPSGDNLESNNKKPASSKIPVDAKTQFWINFWGWGMIVLVCLQELILPLISKGYKVTIEGAIVQLLLGFYITKRSYWARKIILVLSGGVILIAPFWGYYFLNQLHRPELAIGVWSNVVFYLGLFIFLIRPRMGLVFGPSPFSGWYDNYDLQENEKHAIRFWIKIIGSTMMLKGILYVIFYSVAKKNHLNIEEWFLNLIGLTISSGILFKNKYLGWYGGIIYSFVAWFGAALSLLQWQRGAAYIAINVLYILIYLPIFIYLCMPKVGRYFQKTSPQVNSSSS